MYLPKIALLKRGCRGVWNVLGIKDVWGGVWYNSGEKGKHPHMGQCLPMKLCMPPTIVVGGWIGPCRGEVKLVYFSWSAGVSCRTLEECKAIKEPKEDHSWMVLTADKGIAMVVMDKEDYRDKALSLLADYNVITKDPTTKLKNKLAQLLRDIRNQGGLSGCSYRKVYPTSAVPPKIVWPSSNTQSWHPP